MAMEDEPCPLNLNPSSMTQPHHHVFNALQGEINHHIKLAPLLPALQEAGLVLPDILKSSLEESKEGK